MLAEFEVHGSLIGGVAEMENRAHRTGYATAGQAIPERRLCLLCPCNGRGRFWERGIARRRRWFLRGRKTLPVHR